MKACRTMGRKIDRHRLLGFLIALAVLSSGFQSVRLNVHAQTSLPERKSYQFINGQWFDGKSFRRQSFFAVNGVFYAKVQTDVRSGAAEVADKVNQPTSVDVLYSHGALTSTYGHGVEVYE